MAKNVRYMCTDPNKVDEPFKVEEAETVNTPPPPTEKVICNDNDIEMFAFVFHSVCMSC